MIYLIAFIIAIGLTGLVLGVQLLIREYPIRQLQDVIGLTREEAVELYKRIEEAAKNDPGPRQRLRSVSRRNGQ